MRKGKATIALKYYPLYMKVIFVEDTDKMDEVLLLIHWEESNCI